MQKILLLEDDIGLIDSLAYSLRKNGFDIEVARTIREAERLISENSSFHHLLFDVSLPDGNILSSGSLTADLAEGKVFLEEKPVEFTGAEYRLLCLFLKNSGRAINDFQKVQAHMKNAKEEHAEKTYEGLKNEYISLKAVLTSLGVNLINIDKIKE